MDAPFTRDDGGSGESIYGWNALAGRAGGLHVDVLRTRDDGCNALRSVVIYIERTSHAQ